MLLTCSIQTLKHYTILLPSSEDWKGKKSHQEIIQKKKKHHKNEELKLAKWVYRYKLVYHSASSLPDG